jgi:hypothetical protein
MSKFDKWEMKIPGNHMAMAFDTATDDGNKAGH